MKIRNILLVATLMFTAAAAMAAENYKEAWAKGLKEYRAKKYKKSAVSLGEATKLAKTANEKYNSMYHQGYSFRYLKRYPKAIKVFGNLLKVEKLSATQKNNTFNQYLHNIYYSKKYKEVIAIAEKTIADDTSSNEIKTSCAYLASLSTKVLKKYDETIKWAKKLQELNPKGSWNARGLIYQAEALRLQKKYKEAEEVLNKGIVAKMSPYRQGDAYMQRGHIKRAMGEPQEAIVEFTTIYELKKGNPNHKASAIVYIVEVFNSAGKLEEADIWIERIDTIKNKYWKTRGIYNQAIILKKQGKLKEAKAKFEECKKTGTWYKKHAEKEIAIINKKLINK